MNKCMDCQFYDRKHSRSSDGRATMWGPCRRQAPHLNPNNGKSYAIEGIWPVVRDDDWCGEWKVLIERPGPASSDADVVAWPVHARAMSPTNASLGMGDD